MSLCVYSISYGAVTGGMYYFTKLLFSYEIKFLYFLRITIILDMLFILRRPQKVLWKQTIWLFPLYNDVMSVLDLVEYIYLRVLLWVMFIRHQHIMAVIMCSCYCLLCSNAMLPISWHAALSTSWLTEHFINNKDKHCHTNYYLK